MASVEEDARDQKPREDEEQLHARPTQLKGQAHPFDKGTSTRVTVDAQLVGEHREDGNAAQTIQRRDLRAQCGGEIDARGLGALRAGCDGSDVRHLRGAARGRERARKVRARALPCAANRQQHRSPPAARLRSCANPGPRRHSPTYVHVQARGLAPGPAHGLRAPRDLGAVTHSRRMAAAARAERRAPPLAHSHLAHHLVARVRTARRATSAHPRSPFGARARRNRSAPRAPATAPPARAHAEARAPGLGGGRGRRDRLGVPRPHRGPRPRGRRRRGARCPPRRAPCELARAGAVRSRRQLAGRGKARAGAPRPRFRVHDQRLRPVPLRRASAPLGGLSRRPVIRPPLHGQALPARLRTVGGSGRRRRRGGPHLRGSPARQGDSIGCTRAAGRRPVERAPSRHRSSAASTTC